MTQEKEVGDLDYYQAIEEAFLAKTNSCALITSSADWEIMRKWRKGGIPLRIILRAIDDTKLSGVRTLRYLQEPVKASYEHWSKSLGL